MSTDLYRFYGAGAHLLYVGITDNLRGRVASHSEKAWWAEVRNMTVSKYATRAEALQAESMAIATEHPVHNVQGRRRGQEAPIPIATGQQYEDIASAANRLGVSTKTVRRYIAAGRLTGYRVGPHLLRLNPSEVDRLLRPVVPRTP